MVAVAAVVVATVVVVTEVDEEATTQAATLLRSVEAGGKVGELCSLQAGCSFLQK